MPRIKVLVYLKNVVLSIGIFFCLIPQLISSTIINNRTGHFVSNELYFGYFLATGHLQLVRKLTYFENMFMCGRFGDKNEKHACARNTSTVIDLKNVLLQVERNCDR